MSLTPHPIFSKMSETFANTFGDPVAFITQTGAKTFQAIIREEADELNETTGGSGTVGDIAWVQLATADAASLAEGDTLVHQGISFTIAGAPRDDGRGMTGFDLTRV